MLNYEEILRKSGKLGLKTYLMWKKKEMELRNRIRVYLDNIHEMYISDKEVCDLINQLENQLCEFSIIGFSESKEAVKEFFKPLDNLIDVEKTNFCRVCREIDYLKIIWESNVKQGVESLECMCQTSLNLSQPKCNAELLFILIYFFHKNKIYFKSKATGKEKLSIIENIIFPNSKVYNRFKEVFQSNKTEEEQFEKFWKYEYPKYVMK